MRFTRILLASLLALVFAPATMAQENTDDKTRRDAERGLALAIDRVERQKARIGKIEWKSDRFENQTLVQLDFMQITGGKFDGIHMNAAFICPGLWVRSCKPDNVLLGMLVVLKGAKYDLPGKLTVLADGERLPLGNMRNVGAVNVMPEWDIIGTSLATLISRDTFLKITKAKRVEMKLDYTEFELNSEQHAALYSLSTLVIP